MVVAGGAESVIGSATISLNCQWMFNSIPLTNNVSVSITTITNLSIGITTNGTYTNTAPTGDSVSPHLVSRKPVFPKLARLYSTVTSILTISNLETIDAGTYSVIVTNSAGVTTSSNATLTVAVPLTVQVQASPTIGGSASGGGSYATGSTATVTATPNACYGFVNWTVNGIQASASPSYTFTVVNNETLVANFSPDTVTTASSPSTGGATSGGGTITCGSNITVMASANPCYTFANWTDQTGTVVSASPSYTFTPSGNETLTANFTSITYTINTSSSPSAGGSTSGGGAVDCGTSVTVTATANALYKFVNWTDQSGTVVSASPSYTFTAIGNETLVANFFTLAERVLPSGNWQGVGYWPNYKMVYTIQAAPPSGTLSYAVQEQVLAPINAQGSNFVISSISASGTFDKVNSLIKFGPFFDDTPRTLTYELNPPPDATNNVQFAGMISIDGANYTLSGPNYINLLPLHPADNSPPIENAININDVTAYGSAWKIGSLWPVLPNPIPIAFVTSAGLIWKGGEYYVYNPSAGAPPSCWVPTNAPATPAARPEHQTALPEILAIENAVSKNKAACSMPNVYTAGAPFTVTLTITPASSVEAYAVQDQIPEGWTATNYSDNGGAFDAVNNEVKWGPFFNNSSVVLTYQVIPPLNADNVVTFAGTASFGGVGIPITGVRQASPDLPPTITLQPISRTTTAGSTAILDVTANGLSPLSYQWFKNSSKLGSNSRISGATSNTLTIRSLATTDSGNYFVTVANSLGRATSSIATLDVVAPPTITILSPKKNTSVRNATLVVTGEASSKLAVTNVFYQLNGDGWNAAQTGNGWSNWTANVSLAAGLNKLAAYAIDALGQSSLTNAVSVTYVASAPPKVVNSNYDAVLGPNDKTAINASARTVTPPVNVIRCPAVGKKLTNSVLIATGGGERQGEHYQCFLPTGWSRLE